MKPLSIKRAKLFIMFSLMELNEEVIPEEMMADNFLAMIVKKRIDVMKLPIKFTDYALMGVATLTDRPGSAVLLLIDALNNYENQTVTMGSLSELYPFGFYNEEELIDIIDNKIKTHKMKWSEIY